MVLRLSCRLSDSNILEHLTYQLLINFANIEKEGEK